MTVMKEFFLPPERNIFGLVSSRSTLSSLSVGDNGPWFAARFRRRSGQDSQGRGLGRAHQERRQRTTRHDRHLGTTCLGHQPVPSVSVVDPGLPSRLSTWAYHQGHPPWPTHLVRQPVSSIGPVQPVSIVVSGGLCRLLAWADTSRSSTFDPGQHISIVSLGRSISIVDLGHRVSADRRLRSTRLDVVPSWIVLVVVLNHPVSTADQGQSVLIIVSNRPVSTFVSDRPVLIVILIRPISIVDLD
ncbi:hypothetical protein DEO72_LG1g1262 [Vigna unguiculata]|uniref:Uncharacterized protein n=1 Tax=Vigna unguiculata TaxID=3917 RepID=A0A4D6KIC8_VIGUN|nr:hypothetical protein DEO72_LG1g1262 [Vigna unguiculata]